MISRSLVALVWVLLPVVSAAQNKQALKPTHADVTYDEHSSQVLDVYQAKADQPTPAIVYIHGGGWRAGSHKKVPNYLLNIVEQGWASLISIEYRFTTVATHPAQVNDSARALQFIRANAKQWNIDPDYIAAIGTSAGGHLALWLALHDDFATPGSADPIKQQSSRLRCAVGLAGPTDWSLLDKLEHKHPAYRQILGYAPGTPAADMDTEQKRSVSPISFASKDDPPVLIVHGDADNIVPIDHAKRLHTALRKAKSPSQLRIIKGGGHNLPTNPQDTKAIVGFLQRNLIPRAKPSGKTQLPQALIDSLQPHTNLTYANYGDRSLQLDLYKPKAAKNKVLPGIVCVHGGGWSKGSKESHSALAMALAAHGYVAVTISYRLSGEAPFPAAIHDCKAAVRWMRANADKYGIDPENIGAIGLSAGGHLTALLATSSGVAELEGDGGHAEFSSKIQAAIPLGAQTDTTSERTREISKTSSIWQQFLGGSLEQQPDNYRLASPLTHLEKEDPPILLIAGEFDNPSTRAKTFREQMKHLGIETGYVELYGAPHGFLTGQNWFDTCIEKSTEFFAQHLGR